MSSKNSAKNGRSTKTFLNEGLWAKALALKPDVILIQFGHNDSHDPKLPEATNAATDYAAIRASLSTKPQPPAQLRF